MEPNGDINLSDISTVSQVNPTTGDTILVPRRLLMLLGATLAQFNRLFPEEMSVPSLGVSIKKNTTEEE